MLTLGISTSSGKFAIVFGIEKKVLYSSDNLKLSENKDIRKLVETGLSKIGKTVDDLSSIIVDNGPGGTSSVRTGVAFANSLAYALNIGVAPVSSLELLGIEAFDKFHKPVICSINSTKGNIFVGLFDKNELKSAKYGKIETILPDFLTFSDEFVLIGHQSTRIMELSQDKTYTDTNLTFANVETLLTKSHLFNDKIVKFPKYIIPITEENYQ